MTKIQFNSSLMDSLLLVFGNSKCGMSLVISWHYEVEFHCVIHNDKKSVWLVGESKGEIYIGFLVSIRTSITPH